MGRQFMVVRREERLYRVFMTDVRGVFRSRRRTVKIPAWRERGEEGKRAVAETEPELEFEPLRL